MAGDFGKKVDDFLTHAWREPGGFVVGAFLAFFGLFTIWIGKDLVPMLLLAIEEGKADETNKLLLAIAAILGVYFLVWRTWIADRQRHVSQEELYTSLLIRAVEQLGATREEKTYVFPQVQLFSPDYARANGLKPEAVVRTVPNTEVRLGAIYALEKLAADYLPLHWQIMEILCAYVRKNAGPPRPCSEEVRAVYAKHPTLSGDERALLAAREAELKSPAVDVQTALTVIGRRSASQRDWERKSRDETLAQERFPNRLDFRKCHLAKVEIRELYFEHADFTESCLEQVRAPRAHLEGAQIYDAHLEGATFGGAYLQRTNMYRTHLEGALLEKAHLEVARLDQAIGLTQKQLDSALGDENTTLPAGLTRPAHWIKGGAGGEGAAERPGA